MGVGWCEDGLAMNRLASGANVRNFIVLNL